MLRLTDGMSTLFLVRHGQASFFGADYDRLSELGVEQTRLLGSHWARTGIRFESAWVGPRRRHWQTFEAVQAVFTELEQPFPEPSPMDELDEYPAVELLKRAIPILVEEDAEAAEWLRAYQAGTAMSKGNFQRLFARVTRRYVRGDLGFDDVEDWEAFRDRVTAGIRRVQATTGRSTTSVAFTSGGPMAAAVGLALGITDEEILELSWIIRNAALAEFLFDAERFSLAAFNTTPHLADPDKVTYR